MDAEPAIDPTAVPADAPQVDADGNPIEGEPIPSVISEEVMQDMKNIWSVFDVEEKNQVSINELKTIMRALAVDVSTDNLVEEIRQMLDPDNSGYFTF